MRYHLGKENRMVFFVLYTCFCNSSLDTKLKQKEIQQNLSREDFDKYLDIIGMTRAVHMAVMPVLCLVLHACSIDCDTAGFLFWGFVDLIIGQEAGSLGLRQHWKLVEKIQILYGFHSHENNFDENTQLYLIKKLIQIKFLPLVMAAVRVVFP